jgi:hypothetical protein
MDCMDGKICIMTESHKISFILTLHHSLARLTIPLATVTQQRAAVFCLQRDSSTMAGGLVQALRREQESVSHNYICAGSLSPDFEIQYIL